VIFLCIRLLARCLYITDAGSAMRYLWSAQVIGRRPMADLRMGFSWRRPIIVVSVVWESDDEFDGMSEDSADFSR